MKNSCAFGSSGRAWAIYKDPFSKGYVYAYLEISGSSVSGGRLIYDFDSIGQTLPASRVMPTEEDARIIRDRLNRRIKRGTKEELK